MQCSISFFGWLVGLQFLFYFIFIVVSPPNFTQAVVVLNEVGKNEVPVIYM